MSQIRQPIGSRLVLRFVQFDPGLNTRPVRQRNERQFLVI
jgi:hypothetical protein